MKIVRLVFFIALLILITIFASQNTSTVTLYFFATSISGSLSLILLITFFLGLLCGILFLLPSFIKSSFRQRPKNVKTEKAQTPQSETPENKGQ